MRSRRADRFKNPLIRAGTVARVHEDRFTCDISLDGDDAYAVDVPLVSLYLHPGRGQGVYVMPEVGSRVMACLPSDGDQYHILGFISEAEVPEEETEGEANTDHRDGRPPLAQGDVALASREGAHVVLRRSGVLELGAGPGARTFYLPLQNIIRTFAESYELVTAAGTLRLATDRDPDAEGGEDVSPGVFQLHVRDVSGDVPVVRLDAGRLEELSDRALPGGLQGRILWRLQVGSTDDSRLDESTPYSGNYEQRVDSDGNLLERLDGSRSSAVERTFLLQAGRIEEYTQSYVLHVLQGSEDRVDGSKVLETGGSRVERVGGEALLDVAGDSAVRVGGAYTHEAVTESRLVKGQRQDVVWGTRLEATLEDHSESVAGDQRVQVGKAQEVVVGNQDNANIGCHYLLRKGTFRIRSEQAPVHVMSGSSADAPQTEVELRATGKALVKWAAGSGFLVGDAGTGALRLGNLAGFLKVTESGQVQIGPGLAGFVVTTLTHPNDFVTGSPILGSSQMVVAGAPASAVPTPVLSTPNTE